jgi:Ca-activated chloride channel family protein
MFKFARPEAFWLMLGLIPLLGIFLWYLWGRGRALKKLGNRSLLQRLAPDLPRQKHKVKFFLIAFAYACLIVALARPQWSMTTRPVTRSGVDLLVAMDVSNSMLATDVKPTRLDQAKQFVSSLIDKLKGDRVGLIIFAGNAYLQVPLTSDYIATKSLLRTVSPRLAPTQGTAIGQAINLANDAFVKGEKQYKALLVISDGENHEGEAIEAAQAAADSGVVILSMGVGSTKGVPIPVVQNGREIDYKRDREGNIVLSRLNPDMLEEIAQEANGKYFTLEGGSRSVNEVLNVLAEMEQKKYDEVIFTDFEDQFQWFLALGLFALLLEFFLSERKNRWLADRNIFGQSTPETS